MKVGIVSLCVFITQLPSPCSGRRLNAFVHHFVPLSYNGLSVHMSHIRTKRSLSNEKQVHVRFYGHNRYFHLRLSRDASVFHKRLVTETTASGIVRLETGHIFRGIVLGDPQSHVYGSLHNGVFEGRIETSSGKFYVETAWKFIDRPTSFHSVLYSSRDIRIPHATRSKPVSWCGVSGETEEWMRKVLESRRQNAKEHQYQRTRHPLYARHLHTARAYQDVSPRIRRAEADHGPSDRYEGKARRQRSATSGHVCNLEIAVDHTLFRKFSEPGMSREQTRERISSIIAAHVDKLNKEYSTTNFNGIKAISFVVQRIKINDSADCIGIKGEANPFCTNAIDASSLLRLHSLSDHENFCLSFAWTYRSFADGVLGLAWVAEPNLEDTGICGKMSTSPGKSEQLSLNTGIITFLNYNSFVPMVVTEITFSHEVGHSFGSPHDNGSLCTPGEPDGNYLMFPYATRGTRKNNDKFSPCSISNISRILASILNGQSAKGNCFQGASGPICGNNIREGSEECDCGLDDIECKDKCCYAPQNIEGAAGCMLRPGAQCSPSAGRCCSQECHLLPRNTTCMRANDCTFPVSCDGVNPQCPRPVPKKNMTLCNNNTQVCLKGLCLGSICEKHGLKECTLLGGDYSDSELCLVACKGSLGDKQCRPVCEFKNMSQQCGLRMMPGSPCNGMRGYCDVFQKCRPIDADGPLFRLRNALLESGSARTVRQYILNHAIISTFVLISVIWIILLGLRFCAIHTPSENPSKKPTLKLKDTLKYLGTKPRHLRSSDSDIQETMSTNRGHF